MLGALCRCAQRRRRRQLKTITSELNKALDGPRAPGALVLTELDSVHGPARRQQGRHHHRDRVRSTGWRSCAARRTRSSRPRSTTCPAHFESLEPAARRPDPDARRAGPPGPRRHPGDRGVQGGDPRHLRDLVPVLSQLSRVGEDFPRAFGARSATRSSTRSSATTPRGAQPAHRRLHQPRDPGRPQPAGYAVAAEAARAAGPPTCPAARPAGPRPTAPDVPDAAGGAWGAVWGGSGGDGGGGGCSAGVTAAASSADGQGDGGGGTSAPGEAAGCLMAAAVAANGGLLPSPRCCRADRRPADLGGSPGPRAFDAFGARPRTGLRPGARVCCWQGVMSRDQPYGPRSSYASSSRSPCVGVAFVGARYAQLDRLVTDESYTVVAHFDASGGIFTGAEVTYRGVSSAGSGA